MDLFNTYSINVQACQSWSYN